MILQVEDVPPDQREVPCPSVSQLSLSYISSPAHGLIVCFQSRFIPISALELYSSGISSLISTSLAQKSLIFHKTHAQDGNAMLSGVDTSYALSVLLVPNVGVKGPVRC